MGDVADLTTADLAALIGRLAEMPPAGDDGERVDRISHLESMKAAIAAAQAVEAVRLDCSQRQAQAAAGVPAERQGRGVAAQIALARRVSPWQAQRWLGWAKIMTAELPATFAELAAGRTSEWRSMLIARETAVLSREHRAAVDTELAPHLAGWGDKRVDAETRKAAYRLDPAASVARASTAVSERRVSIRPAPDTMVRLSALLPVADGVGLYASLARAADSRAAAGDPRSRGQAMADTLIERVTGLATADGIGVEIVLVMPADTILPQPTDGEADPDPADTRPADTDPADTKSIDADSSEADSSGADSIDAESIDAESIDSEPADAEPADAELADADPAEAEQGDTDSSGAEQGSPVPAARPRPGWNEPAWIQGYGPVPAGWARQLAYGRADKAPAGPRWIRRLYTRHGRPIELESTRRLFTDGQQRFLRLRDQTCRTPFCNAPIRHADHIDPHDNGGPTHTDNGEGLCEACNHARQAPGWLAIVHPDGTITTRTPTGHTYNSPPPNLTGPPTKARPPNTAA